MKNSFNQVSHHFLLSECAEHFPEFLPWVRWCYGQHPYLWHSLGCLISESGVQHGDHLGPLLFSLVSVKSISNYNTCFSNLFHAWYMDDGVLAGQGNHCARLSIFCRSMVQLLGLHVNLSKCKVNSHNNLDMFLSGMKAYHKPNIEILGVTIEDLDFCSSFISAKRMEARALLSQLEQVGMIDPQVALVLRLCSGFCKLVHLARSKPPSLSAEVALSLLFDDEVSAWVLMLPKLPGIKLSSA